MPDPVETAVDAPETTPSPAPATPAPAPDVDALVNAAVEKTRREAQAAKDREIARVHQTYQQQLAGLKGAATSRLKQLGDQGADNWNEEINLRTKAEQFDAIQAEAGQWAAWNSYVAQVATAHKLDPSDRRLAGATDASDLLAKATKAMTEDVDAERKRLLSDAAAAKRDAIDKKIAAGDLDTLGGKPAGGGDAGGDLREKYQKELQTVRGKGAMAGQKIREKYRELGLNV